jgi:hypothetical protein
VLRRDPKINLCNSFNLACNGTYTAGRQCFFSNLFFEPCTNILLRNSAGNFFSWLNRCRSADIVARQMSFNEGILDLMCVSAIVMWYSILFSGCY